MTLNLPPLFLLPTHLEPGELHALEERIHSLTYNPQEAEIIVGKITKRERAMFELRRMKLETEPVSEEQSSASLHASNAQTPVTEQSFHHPSAEEHWVLSRVKMNNAVVMWLETPPAGRSRCSNSHG